MFVAATTACFPDLPLPDAVGKLADLEFTSIEIDISESGIQLQPSAVAESITRAVIACNATQRLSVVSYFVDITAEGEAYYEQFEACCKLAKATKVVTLTVPSSQLGTPFNEEVERFKRLVQIAEYQGVRVGMLSETGKLSEDPDTVSVICDHVNGLALTLDPSHYIYRRESTPNMEKLLKYVHHVYLRDTTKNELQVQVGQGNVEYGKLVNYLVKANYQRALCVKMQPDPEIDYPAELRKLRLLLESLLV